MIGGESVYKATFEHGKVAAGPSISDETFFLVCSLTKAMTAAALGSLVEDGKTEWDTLVKDMLPTFDSRDETLQNCPTITDLLSHRSGMAWTDNLVIGTDNNILIQGKDGSEYVSTQRLLPFRGQFAYNNLPYDLAGNVIEQISGQSWSEFLQTRILDPLGLDRTYLTPPPGATNVTHCYNTLDDLTKVPIPCPKVGSDRFAGPSGGMWSCVRDLQKLYTSYGRTFKDQFDTERRRQMHLHSSRLPTSPRPRSPWTNHRSGSSRMRGWGRVQLTNRMGQIGLNHGLIPDGMPIIGKAVPSQLVIFHQGSHPGALAIVMLLPDSENVIIVLSNSPTLTDVPDWVGQLVLEELLDVSESERVDYLAPAKAVVAENLKWYPELVKELDAAQKHGTSRKDLEEYVGVYCDTRIFKIAVTLEDGRLFWALQGLDSESTQPVRYRRPHARECPISALPRADNPSAAIDLATCLEKNEVPPRDASASLSTRASLRVGFCPTYTLKPCRGVLPEPALKPVHCLARHQARASLTSQALKIVHLWGCKCLPVTRLLLLMSAILVWRAGWWVDGFKTISIGRRCGEPVTLTT